MPIPLSLVLVSLICASVLLASCGDDPNGDATPTTSSIQPQTRDIATAVTTASAGRTATLNAETFVSDRTLPPAALSAERLEDAGTAATPDGSPVPMARAVSSEVADWETVSPDADGWLVWRPKVVLDILEDAGDGATSMTVESVNWPDACMGIEEPGIVCAQVVTPGYLVEVDRDGETIEYHASRAGVFRRVPAAPD